MSYGEMMSGGVACLILFISCFKMVKTGHISRFGRILRIAMAVLSLAALCVGVVVRNDVIAMVFYGVLICSAIVVVAQELLGRKNGGKA